MHNKKVVKDDLILSQQHPNNRSIKEKTKKFLHFNLNLWKLLSDIIIPISIPITIFFLSYEVNKQIAVGRQELEKSQQELKLLEIYSPAFFDKDTSNRSVAIKIISSLNPELWSKIALAFIDDKKQPESLRYQTAKLLANATIHRITDFNIYMVYEKGFDNTKEFASKLSSIIRGKINSQISMHETDSSYFANNYYTTYERGIKILFNPDVKSEPEIAIQSCIKELNLQENVSTFATKDIAKNEIYILIRNDKPYFNNLTGPVETKANLNLEWSLNASSLYSPYITLVVDWKDGSPISKLKIEREKSTGRFSAKLNHAFLKNGIYNTSFKVIDIGNLFTEVILTTKVKD